MKQSHRVSIVACIFLMLFAWLNPLFAGVDKSGVKPSVLSLPSGPGSLEGLGESFEPQLNSGTATYRVPLATPPGRAGFAPQLALAYDSGHGNGPFGLGWRLDFPFIQRQTDKGQPFYTTYPNDDGLDNDQDGATDEYDEFDTLIFANGEELMPTTTGFWRLENEAEFIRFARQDEGWTATRKDGVTMTFGLSAAARVQDGSGRIFKWYLESMTDLNGNAIQFSYQTLDAGRQIYGAQITYNVAGANAMAIEFLYEARPDIITDYRPRFELSTAYRCREIRMTAGGQPVRSYRLQYHPTSDIQPLSLLASITQVGRDGFSTLPPAEFTYTQFQGRAAQPVAMPAAPRLSLNNGNTDLLDLNADGLPDILDTNETVHDYYLNLGPDGNGVVRWSAQTNMTAMPKPLYLSSDATQVADMDGNGQTDLLDLTGMDVQFYRIVQTASGMQWSSGGLINEAGFAFSDPNVRLVDLNNDKLIDVLRTTATDYFAWINLQDGRWSAAYTPAPPNPQMMFDRSYTRLADMNGDRLQDLVRLENDYCVYYPGQGFGEFGAGILMENPPFGVTDEKRLLLADVNGDGLEDALYVSESTVKVWLNLGLYSADHTRGRFSDALSASAPYTDSFTVFRQADMNGNGSQDIVWNTYPTGGSETFTYLDFAPGEQPYQLKTITNGIGRTIMISYRSSVEDMIRDREAGRPWPETIPFPVPVVGSIAVHDGLQTYRTEFAYHDGYYDGLEKEFRGFAGAEKRQIGDSSAPTLMMVHTFDTGVQEDALKGKPLVIEAQTESGEIFYREAYTWQTRVLEQGISGDERNITFPYQSHKLRDVLEQGHGTPVQLNWSYAYDDYGNLTNYGESGRADRDDDSRSTETHYSAEYPSGLAAWILDKIVTQTISSDSQRVSETRNYYDYSDIPGEIMQGNLTKAEEWVADETFIVTTRNDYDDYGNIIAIYDGLYGVEPGHFRTIFYDSAYHTFPEQETIYTGGTPAALSMSAAYDYGLGVMTASTDFNGHTTTYGYDGFGRLTSITKAPDSSPTAEYDYVLAQELGDGRKINWIETRQNEGTGGDFLIFRSFYDGLGRKVMTRAEGEEPGQIVVTDTQQFNARSLPWRQYLPYFDSGTLDFVDPDYSGDFTQHTFDALGRAIRVQQPQGDGFAMTEYQPLARLVQDEEQTDPASPYYGCGMRYVEDGLLNEDGQGRLREVYEIVNLTEDGEPGPITEWKTTYSYDALDNFTGYTDSRGNVKGISYDGLGRRTLMSDPDRGLMAYSYDNAGNLIHTLDAKNQVLRYTYDGVNRLIAEYYGEDTSAPDVQYFYDLSAGPLEKNNWWTLAQAQLIADAVLHDETYRSDYDLNHDSLMDAADVVMAAQGAGLPPSSGTVTARNTLGYLAWVRDQSGEEHNSYDERGRVEWVVKRIDTSPLLSGEGPGVRSLINFHTAMSYDPLDRVTHLIYPDGSLIEYQYNSRGLLEAVPGIIDRYDYNPSGQNAFLQLTAGVQTGYQYDHRLRLKRLSSVRVSDGLLLQDLGYTFDKVSNITHIQDYRSDGILEQIGSELGMTANAAHQFNATQSFDYDVLYRLTQASNPSVYGTINYRYDPIGNMIRKDAALTEPDPLMDLGEMYVDPARPHAISGTQKGPDGPLSFSYDNNGNMTADRGMALAWDYNDRLSSLSNGPLSAAYRYDYSGSRKRKSVTNTETGKTDDVLYIDKFSELRGGKLLKYVYAGNNRIARGEYRGGGNTLFQPAAFYLYDHLGSTSLTLSETAEVQEQSVNYPYGRPRLEQQAFPESQFADYTFTGKEQDIESDLHYFEVRYYAANLSRFISVDPIWSGVTRKAGLLKNPQNLNSYAYANNHCIIANDPNGEIANFIVGAIWGGLTSGATNIIVAKMKGEEINWASLGTDIAIGMAAGAATSGASAYIATTKLIGSTFTRTVLTGVSESAIDATQNAVEQLVKKGSVDINEVGTTVLEGRLIGAIGKEAKTSVMSIIKRRASMDTSISEIIDRTMKNWEGVGNFTEDLVENSLKISTGVAKEVVTQDNVIPEGYWEKCVPAPKELVKDPQVKTFICPTIHVTIGDGK